MTRNGRTSRTFQETGELLPYGFTWGAMKVERAYFNERTGACYVLMWIEQRKKLYEIAVTRTGEVTIWADGERVLPVQQKEGE